MKFTVRNLDYVGLPTQLWEVALAANEHQTGLDHSVVVEFVCQVILLVGNASFYALSDRRKGMRANVSLDLLDETNWFEQNSADLFGKRIQKSHDRIVFYVLSLSYISLTLQKRLRAFIYSRHYPSVLYLDQNAEILLYLKHTHICLILIFLSKTSVHGYSKVGCEVNRLVPGT